MTCRRIIAAALPHLAAEARLRREGQAGFSCPFAIVNRTGVARAGNALRLASVNRAGAAAGLGPGLALADARALCPGLVTRPEEPERLAAFHRGLIRWAGRFAPLVAMEGDALILDATGCAHLFGGEAAMLAALAEALAGHGLTARAAIADTKGAAWALAYYSGNAFAPERAPTSHPASPPSHRLSTEVRSVAGSGGGVGGGTARVEIAPTVAPRGHTRAAIGALPVAALRIAPEAAQGLTALGLASIGDAARIPRGALARRFGLATLKRLDQALGAEPEPVAPERLPPGFATRLTLPEPVGHLDDVMAGLERLLARLCQALETEQRGARRLRLTARRVDGADAAVQIALARPGRDPARLSALFRPRVAELEAGYGIDALRLEATATEPLWPAQSSGRTGSEPLADLVSRLGNRFGFETLARFLPAESHIPERAFTQAAAAWSEPEAFSRRFGSRAAPPRPLTLFPPEPLETAAPPAPAGAAGTPLPPPGGGGGGGIGGGGVPPLADSDADSDADSGNAAGRPGGGPSPPPTTPQPYPPPRFRWRGRWLTAAGLQGPERLAPEWWWDDPAWASGTRDYWRVATAEGPRLWLFHTPQASRPGWWAHGAFA